MTTEQVIEILADIKEYYGEMLKELKGEAE